MTSSRLWYVAYGSNLSGARLDRYLARAPVPDGGGRRPAQDVTGTIDHRLFFAHESAVWTGGSAFLDPVVEAASPSFARWWSLTVEQFWSVLSQENGGAAIAVDPGWLDLAPGETAPATPGRYGLLLGCPSPDDRPALTFTTPNRPLPEPNAPSATYVDTIVAGLVEGHGVSGDAARRYVQARV